MAYSYPTSPGGEAEPQSLEASEGATTTAPAATRSVAPARLSPRPLTIEDLRERHGMYLSNHFLSAHMAVVSLALGIAGIAAATLIAPSPRFAGYQGVLWILWVASLLCTAVAYAGAMTGSIILPSSIPAITDLLLPLLLGVLEFLLFAILAYQATGLSTVTNVLTAWWFALGGFGTVAAAHITRIVHIVERAPYGGELEPTVSEYLRRLRKDRIAASGTATFGMTIGMLHVVLRSMPFAVNYMTAAAIAVGLGKGLLDHRTTAARLHDAFAGAFDD